MWGLFKIKFVCVRQIRPVCSIPLTFYNPKIIGRHVTVNKYLLFIQRYSYGDVHIVLNNTIVQLKPYYKCKIFRDPNQYVKKKNIQQSESYENFFLNVKIIIYRFVFDAELSF